MNQKNSTHLAVVPKDEREAFHFSFTTRLRQDAAHATFPYKNHGDARDPRRDAARIRAALAQDVPFDILHDI